MSKTRVLFITDNFPPEVNAPASRTYEHAKRWVADGVEVTVITGAPNFPQGKVHEGYSNAWRSVEMVDGIRVVRVKTYIAGNEGVLRRIIDYLSFMFSAVFFGAFESRPNLVIGTSPQFFAAFGAWILSVIKRRPFVFELRDIWPASIVTVGAIKKGSAIRLLERLELFLYRRAKAIVAVTVSFKEYLISRGIKTEKIFVVRNGVDLLRFQPRKYSKDIAAKFGVSEKFVVAYLGTHGMAHGLENVLSAAQLLSDNPNIVFLFVGNGAEKQALCDRANALELTNVVFHESVPKEQMPALWSICDVALVHLKDDPVFATVIPSKIFEAFGMGKPIIIVQPDGEASRLVREEGAGVWVPPEKPNVLADTVREWCAHPDRVVEYARKSEAAASRHSRDRLAGEMANVLYRIAES